MVAGLIVKIFVFGLLALVIGGCVVYFMNRRLENEVEHSYADGRDGYDPHSIRFLAASMQYQGTERYVDKNAALRRFIKEHGKVPHHHH